MPLGFDVVGMNISSGSDSAVVELEEGTGAMSEVVPLEALEV